MLVTKFRFYTIKSSRGITLITLIVTIIVLLILAGVATYSGIEAIENSKYTKFSAELKIMQTYVNQWYEDLKAKTGDFDENIQAKFTAVNATNILDNTALASLDAAGIDSSKYANFYFISNEAKEKLGVEGVTQEVLVNIKDRLVVSYRGLSYKGNMYYTAEDVGGMYNVDYTDKNTNRPSISVKGRSVYNGETAKNAKYKFTVDITQSSDYITKGDIYYGKVKNGVVESWYHTDENNFTVDRENNVTYQIYYKDAAGNISNTVEYKIEPKATLAIGQTFNVKMKILAGDGSPSSDSTNTNITEFRITTNKPDNSIINDNHKISAATSQCPVYMWFDNGTIWLWSEENWIYMNSATSMFRKLTNITSIKDLYYLDTSTTNSMAAMFYYDEKLTELDLSDFDTSNVVSFYSMFNHCASLKTLDLSNFNTSNSNDMQAMFMDCINLSNLNISNFNTSNVTNMPSMFKSCNNLTQLNLSSFNTQNVNNMQSMFAYCRKLTSLDLSNFNPANVTNMESMFYECNALSNIKLSGFDTGLVNNMNTMFYNCNHLTDLDLSSFNTSNVTQMASMFSGCAALSNINLTSFNTQNLTNMICMFANCSSLTVLDLSSFNTQKVNNMFRLFLNCSNLKTIYATEYFSVSALTNDEVIYNSSVLGYNNTNLFTGCSSIVGGSGTTYSGSHVDADYAHIDGVGGPGYFTRKNSV